MISDKLIAEVETTQNDLSGTAACIVNGYLEGQEHAAGEPSKTTVLSFLDCCNQIADILPRDVCESLATELDRPYRLVAMRGGRTMDL